MDELDPECGNDRFFYMTEDDYNDMRSGFYDADLPFFWEGNEHESIDDE